MNVGINMIFTIIGDSVVMSSIIGLNTTNRVRADTAAIEKMINMVWRANKESDSSVDSQFDI